MPRKHLFNEQSRLTRFLWVLTPEPRVGFAELWLRTIFNERKLGRAKCFGCFQNEQNSKRLVAQQQEITRHFQRIEAP